MRLFFLLSFCLCGLVVFCQDKQEWAEDYLIQFADFQNQGTEIDPALDSYSLSDGMLMEFGMQKNVYSFAFSKNFNSNVVASFSRTSAVLVAPDSLIAQKLVSFARYSFDLTELYARKFRKRLYEEKETFSRSDFYQPLFEEVNAELKEVHSRVLKLTEFGQDEAVLRHEHQLVKDRILELGMFCKECKPPKKPQKKSR